MMIPHFDTHANSPGVTPIPFPKAWTEPDPDAGATSPRANYEAALRYIGAGLSVIPIDADTGSKGPDTRRLPRVFDHDRNRRVPSWKPYRAFKPTEDQVRGWYHHGGPFGLAVVAGLVSGGGSGLGLEILDSDSADLAVPWAERVEGRCRIDVTLLDAENQLFKVILTGGTGEAFKLREPAGTDDELLALVRKVTDASGLPVEQVRNDLGEKIADARRSAASKIAEPTGYQPGFITSAEFARRVITRTWLVKQVLVEGEPFILGGPKKALKTSVVVDLAVSLGSGTRFLNRFDVPEKARVALLSGESGEGTLQETAFRLCEAKRIILDDCDVLWDFVLPRLSVEGDLLALQRVLRDQRVRVVIIDPAYICLLSGNPAARVQNVFDVGPLLGRIGEMCKGLGVTLVLVHHTSKTWGYANPRYEPLELDALSQSGFAEFARQWLLINPREAPDFQTGTFRMNLVVAGVLGRAIA